MNEFEQKDYGAARAYADAIQTNADNIMGIFDEDSIVKLLDIPDDRELIAITPLGYPDDAPQAPKRKSVEELLEFK